MGARVPGDLSTRQFKVGRFRCLSVSDGGLNYPLPAFFTNAPQDEVARILQERGLPTTHVNTPYTCLFVNTGDHRVMIDTGAGSLARHAGRMFPTVDNSTSVTGTLAANLQAEGVAPADVDIVIITHAHPDHVGGTLAEDGQPVFANARYYITRTEWEFWDSDAAAAVKAAAPMVEIARINLRAVRDRLTLIDDAAEADTEILPGICALAAPGHTPGHMALAIVSGGDRLVHVSDTVLYPLHLEYPDWVPAFDVDPEKAAKSKRRIFDDAARDEALVFAHHFPPFPNLGRVEKQGRGWRWAPIE